MENNNNKFNPDMKDFIFALVAFALGYMFARRVFFTWQGWGVALFTTVYLLSSTLYLIKKNAFEKTAAAWFWLGVTWLTGLSYAIWDNAGFNGYRSLFLFCSAAYYIMIASGSTLKKGTGNYLIIDGLNTLIILPFRNFFNQYVSFKVLGNNGKRGKILPVLIGIVVSVILIAVLTPLLRSADSGGFAVVADYMADLLSFINFDILLYVFLSIPVAAYLYGLISGAAHKKGTDIIKYDSVKRGADGAHIIPAVTTYTVLGAVCVLYVVFIASQLPYLFSAFTGEHPEGWLNYAEYARQGFFELSGIVIINLIIITIGNVTCKKLREDSRILKSFNIILSVITLIFIATAFSKIALYIDAYGLTMRRLLPCMFMLFEAAVFVALIVLQFRSFGVVRFALVTGAVLMCAMCYANPDALVVRYNADRYLHGTLREFDTQVLYRAGFAGVKPALEIYDSSPNAEIEIYLDYAHNYLTEDMPGASMSGTGHGRHLYSVESYLAGEALRKR